MTGTAASPNGPDIADAYVTTYIEELRTQVDEAQQPDIDQLNQDPQSTKDQITLIDAQISRALEPYMHEAPNAATSYRPDPHSRGAGARAGHQQWPCSARTRVERHANGTRANASCGSELHRPASDAADIEEQTSGSKTMSPVSLVALRSD